MKTSPHTINVTSQAEQRDEQFRFVQCKRAILITILLGCVCSFPLIEWLSLDLYVSSLFYSPDTNSWRCCDQQPFSFIDHASVWLTTTVAICCVTFYFVTSIVQSNSWQNRASLIMTLVVLTGPVLLINGVMKPTFSRARPREVQEFGGNMVHTPAWHLSSSPYRNSSFPSGHSSVGFYLIAPAFLIQRNRVRFLAFILLGISFGGIVGFSRIAQGGHFLSDVVCSMFVMTTVSWLISEFVYRSCPVLVPNQRKAAATTKQYAQTCSRESTQYAARI
ncbi:phosphatase PAP2 family protein [Lacunimicrobium album]